MRTAASGARDEKKKKADNLADLFDLEGFGPQGE